MARNIAGRVTQTSGQNGGTVGVPNPFHSNAVPGGSGTIAQIPPPYAYVMAYDHRTSYTMQYLANVQRQVGGNAIYNPAGQPGTNAHQDFGLVAGTPRACGSSRLHWSTAFQTKGTLWKNELAEVF